MKGLNIGGRRIEKFSSRDESVAGKWSDLREYEETMEQGETHRNGEQIEEETVQSSPTQSKLQQLKNNSIRKFHSIRNQISGIHRKSDSDKNKGQTDQEVSDSPNGEDESQNNCGPLSSVGTRIRTSRSLQNLEQVTKDTVRQVVGRTQNIGSNMKHRYGGSRMDITTRSRTGHYDKLGDSDEENLGP